MITARMRRASRPTTGTPEASALSTARTAEAGPAPAPPSPHAHNATLARDELARDPGLRRQPARAGHRHDAGPEGQGAH